MLYHIMQLDCARWNIQHTTANALSNAQQLNNGIGIASCLSTIYNRISTSYKLQLQPGGPGGVAAVLVLGPR
jgi:hypothetical protein